MWQRSSLSNHLLSLGLCVVNSLYQRGKNQINRKDLEKASIWIRAPEVLCKLHRFSCAVKLLACSPSTHTHTHSHTPHIYTPYKNTSPLEVLHPENIENIHHSMDWGRSQATFSVTPGAFTVCSSASSPVTGLSPRSISPSVLISVTSTLLFARSPDNTTSLHPFPTFHIHISNNWLSYSCPRRYFTHLKGLIGQKKNATVACNIIHIMPPLLVFICVRGEKNGGWVFSEAAGRSLELLDVDESTRCLSSPCLINLIFESGTAL